MGELVPTIAYFSMEFALHTDFRIYAGALGSLAGDFLRSAKDNNLPVIGVGILWKQGYVEQHIDSNSNIIDCFYNNDYNFIKDTGVKVTVKIKGKDVFCKVWRVDCFDNSELLLLDTDLPENEDKWITAQLYSWFEEERIAQEMVLGIGGIKALRELNMQIDYFHLNEGNSVFAALELLREKKRLGFNPYDAWEAVRKKIVFTMHTSMEEYNEYHDLDTLEKMGAFNELDRFFIREIGGEPFNMTAAALRLSRKSNSISECHLQDVKKNWAALDKRSDIINITNGVHIPTWCDKTIERAFRKYEDLWEPHMKNKERLIKYIFENKSVMLKKEKLIIGLAKNAAFYKRGNMLAYFTGEIDKYLKEGTVQIVFSSKAHPLDFSGKEFIKFLHSLEVKYPLSVVFLENYNLDKSELLTKGVDIWLSSPRVTKEACGTTGIKAAINGSVNVSTLDGWWPEACWDGVTGWQIGDGYNSENIDEADKHDAESLYNTLINKIFSIYYNDRVKWKELMYSSIRATIDRYSGKRMIDEYYNKLYKSY